MRKDLRLSSSKLQPMHHNADHSEMVCRMMDFAVSILVFNRPCITTPND